MAYNRLQRLFPFVQSWFASHRDSKTTIVLKRLISYICEPTRQLSIFLIKGTVNDETIITLFLGNVEGAHQFAQSMYSEPAQITLLGATIACNADKVKLAQADVTVVNARRRDIKKYQKLGYLILPNISFTLDLRQPIEHILQKMSRRRRRDVRDLHQQNYEYFVSTKQLNDFTFFYSKMYIPYAKKRFGKAAMFYSQTNLENCYKRNGGIIFVTDHKKPLAGILFQIRKDEIYAIVYGICNEDFGAVKNLAGIAALYFLIKWAKNKNLRMLDYGRTIPLFKDGIFTYKKEWGMTIKPHLEQPYCALKLNPQSKKAILLLQNNQFITYDKGKLKGCCILTSKPEKEELQNICKRYYMPGLESTVILFYDHNSHTCKTIQHPTKYANSTFGKPENILSQSLIKTFN